ncbi:hypothetical protein I5Q29_07745 [Pseudomonas sp. URMO17WK12:I11]|nr:hypothetical protein [Pseudomonas sp. URMO17WK12:I11]
MGHVNAMIYGPTGLVLSEKLRVGVSLLAPFVRHSDHRHRAKEMYLVVSEGEFRQGESEWVLLAIGALYIIHHTSFMRCVKGRSPCWRFGRLPMSSS